MSFDNVINADGLNGISVAITGMTIVFVVLVLVSLFITCLPRVLPIVDWILPPKEHHHAVPTPPAAPRPVTAPQTGDEEQIVAAIGFAMHQRRR